MSIKIGDVVGLRISVGVAIGREMDVIAIVPRANFQNAIVCEWIGRAPLYKGELKIAAYWENELRILRTLQQEI